jgi:hypothetical protein
MNKTNNHIPDAGKMVQLKQAIIEKIHGLPWEEARWVDTFGETRDQLIKGAYDLGGGSLMIDYDYNQFNGIYYRVKEDEFYLSQFDYMSWEPGSSFNKNPAPGEMEPQPITLSRVLQALRNCKEVEEVDLHGNISSLEIVRIIPWGNSYRSKFDRIEWKLLKEDKSTATLEDQSEETIEALKTIFL